MQSSGEQPLIVDVRATDAGSEVTVSGEVDLSTGSTFRDALTEAANGPGHSVVVNLDGVTFMDSTGLRALSERWTGATGKRWSLSGVSAPVRRIIEMTGMSDVFEIDSTDPGAKLAEARAEYEAALERNREAIREGQHPPVGTGALLVLERRIAAAELRLRRHNPG